MLQRYIRVEFVVTSRKGLKKALETAKELSEKYPKTRVCSIKVHLRD